MVNLKTGIHNPNISLSEHLLKAIKTHRQQVTALDAGLCVVIQKQTTSDFDPIFLLDTLNETLFNWVTSIISKQDLTNSPIDSLYFGLPLMKLNKLDIVKTLKLKTKMNEVSIVSIFGFEFYFILFFL